jgi:citrate-Mg2+:H+ or citrate-Ca2+:H+ symporter, CitMHS family
MSPVVLTCVTATATANGVLNTVLLGGATARAAAALKVSPIDILVPMIPTIAAGTIAILVFAYLLGRSQHTRLGAVVELREVVPFSTHARFPAARSNGMSRASLDLV